MGWVGWRPVGTEPNRISPSLSLFLRPHRSFPPYTRHRVADRNGVNEESERRERYAVGRNRANI